MKPAREICNPAWDIWVRIYGADRENFSANSIYSTTRWKVDRLIEDHRIRQQIIDHMTFAIPDPDSLDLIAKLGPIVEMGAGTGYWAWLLRQMGVDVIAFDRYPPQTHPVDEHRSKGRNGWFDTYWTHVNRGSAKVVSRYPERALMMIWPYMNEMAIDAVRAYRGSTLIYVGEERAACATDAFFDELDEHWVRVEERIIPQWLGLHDELWICRRA